MAEPTQTAQAVRFGAIEMDLRTGELRKHGIRIKLQEQPFQILTMLLERPGGVVTREELRAKLWPADTFVDFDHGLNSAVNKLREALGDSAENPRYIETLPRRGYRFIGRPEEKGEVDQAPRSVPVPASVIRIESTKTKDVNASARRKYWLAGTVAVAVLALGVSAYMLNALRARQRMTGKPLSAPIQSIAVLPLANLSGDSEEEYFADGMTEELIARLAQVSTLRVISRTSVMQYKGVNKALPVIAKELGVDAVVEGAVLHSGDRVRITAELLDARTDRHLWAQDYERDLRDVLKLQSEVATAVAQEIHAQLAPELQQRLTGSRAVNAEAYQAYLRGQFLLKKRTTEAEKKALDYFNYALEKDPSYAPAYVGIASSYGLLAFYGGMPARDAFPREREAVLRAVELDSSLAEVHTALAILRGKEWNWTESERQFRRAIELSPNLSDTHHAYSQLLMRQKRFDEALAENRREQELDPLWRGVVTTEETILYFARRYEQVLDLARKALALEPNQVSQLGNQGLVYEQQGRLSESIARFESVRKLAPNSLFALADLGHAYALAGRAAEAERILRELKQPAEGVYVPPYQLAVVCAGLGRKQDMLAWLNKAFEDRDPWLGRLGVDPRFDEFRSDVQFKAIIHRLGLPE